MNVNPQEVMKEGKVWKLFPRPEKGARYHVVFLTPEERAAVERIGAQQRVAAGANGVHSGTGCAGSLLRALAAGAVRLVPPVEELPGKPMTPPEVQRGCPVEELGNIEH